MKLFDEPPSRADLVVDADDKDDAHQQIADLTAAFCRGVDRADEAFLKNIFHEDSVVVSGAFKGNGQKFAGEICNIVRAVFDQTLHSITEQSIEVVGDTAKAETYVIAVLTMTDLEKGKSEMLTGGRYHDRFTRRDGVWKFSSRNFESDWSRINKTSCDIFDGSENPSELSGDLGLDDPIYAMWN